MKTGNTNLCKVLLGAMIKSRCKSEALERDCCINLHLMAEMHLISKCVDKCFSPLPYTKSNSVDKRKKYIFIHNLHVCDNVSV